MAETQIEKIKKTPFGELTPEVVAGSKLMTSERINVEESKTLHDVCNKAETQLYKVRERAEKELAKQAIMTRALNVIEQLQKRVKELEQLLTDCREANKSYRDTQAEWCGHAKCSTDRCEKNR